MKGVLLLFAFVRFVALSASAGEPPGIKELSVRVGTLTLEKEAIVFRPEDGKATHYKFSPVRFLSIPGVSMARHEPDGELDVETLSRLVLRAATGDVLDLRRNLPLPVFRVELTFHQPSPKITIWKPKATP